MSPEQPNFILRGARNFAERTLPWAIGGLAVGVAGVSFLIGPMFAWTLGDIAALSFISKSRIPQASQ